MAAAVRRPPSPPNLGAALRCGAVTDDGIGATPASAAETDISAALTDDEGSEVSDSEFGLSDKQLEDFWLNFKPEIAIDEGDEEGRDHEDADFGLSAEQFALLGRTLTENEDPLRQSKNQSQQRRSLPAVLPISEIGAGAAGYSQRRSSLPSQAQDPLGLLMKERASSKERASTDASVATTSSVPKAKDAESFIAESFARRPSPEPRAALWSEPEARAARRSAPQRAPPTASMVSSREVAGTVWYLFRIFDQGEERFYMKRYSDFQRLDGQLRIAVRTQGPLPELPESGLFGLRQKLGVRGFRRRRKDGLERYVYQLITVQARSMDDPLLEAFFGPHAPGRMNLGRSGVAREVVRYTQRR